ncbi:hypothetical protein CC85DRAFT_305538 [Cutaneotrichosporon oleaginosum]|uniref:Uncharacterized protein n=1 Tax=Cutaneotrichosporon oleaginosum TaxID=879819 RepID=A0A0J0XCV3_9TREE|nr:uncharacterized protein CC85DRAFT_305538 [Cutaneotrichosporon oleaginosum]KLT38891.1 hypothetical protein CC85DRAFT_305538 [Cutaneotrichosporon oleaginosum]TXT10372.1 hypothetical protein COLE_04306 [Cutaneotrichosporon oleaginosum]
MLSRARIASRPARPLRATLARSYVARADPPEGQEPPFPTPSERTYTGTTLAGENTPRGQEPPLEERTYATKPAPQAGQSPRPEIPLPPPPKAAGSSKTLMLVAVVAAIAGAAFIPWYKSEKKLDADTRQLILQREVVGAEERARLESQIVNSRR